MELLTIAVVTISSGQSLSSAVDLLDRTITGIQMPADWDAADLTFQAAPDLAGTYLNVYPDDSDTETTIQAASDRYIAIQPQKLAGLRYIKVRSGTSGGAVNQTADRTIILMGSQIA